MRTSEKLALPAARPSGQTREGPRLPRREAIGVGAGDGQP
jgi:hypothetical protein